MSEFFLPQTNTFTQDYSEIARYLGYKKSNPPTADILDLIKKAAGELLTYVKPQAVYEIFDLSFTQTTENNIHFGNVEISSADLGINLKNCSKIVLLAATIGPNVDSFIRRFQKKDPVYAAILNATGAMYIEQTVDLLNEKIKQDFKSKGFSTRPRFSPGYGDVSLETQKIFFNLLPCTRIGLTLMDTLIMAPEKSVTAFIGIK